MLSFESLYDDPLLRWQWPLTGQGLTGIKMKWDKIVKKECTWFKTNFNFRSHQQVGEEKEEERDDDNDDDEGEEEDEAKVKCEMKSSEVMKICKSQFSLIKMTLAQLSIISTSWVGKKQNKPTQASILFI